MKVGSLKPFDDGKYLSEEEAMKLLESIPIPEDDSGEVEVEKLLPPETSGHLEIITGNYLEAIQAAIPETIQTSAELQKARVEFNFRGDTSLNKVFYTANVPLYGVENGKPFLLFGEREVFLRLYVPKIEEVCRQILSSSKGYVIPDADKAWALGEGIRSNALKRFDLAELIETKHDKGYGYFTINTNNCAQLNGAKRKLAELIHGQGNDYFNAFKMFEDKGISETKVWLLNPDYVISTARNNLMGRASWLDFFGNDSNFVAIGRGIYGSGRVRGVRHGSAAGATSKNGGSP